MIKHNGTNTSLFGRWIYIRTQCNTKTQVKAKGYDAEKLDLAPAWEEFGCFRDWALANGYRPELYIARKDRAKGYNPNNCHFVEKRHSARDINNRLTLTAYKETKTLDMWVKDARCAVDYQVLRGRLKAGWDPVKCLAAETNTTRSHKLTIYNQTKTIAEWAEDERCLVNHETFSSRITRGWDPLKALTKIPTGDRNKR
jgi:hypothetical protein